MRNLWGCLKVEWKLLFRGPLFWGCCLVFAGVYYLFSLDDRYAHNIGHHAMDQSMFLMVVFFAGLFLAMHAARRDYATRSHLLHGALPVRLWALHASRVIGVAAPLSVVALLPAIMFAAAMIREGIPLNEGATGLLALVSSVVPVWLVVVAGYALSALTNKRWIYLIGLAGFMSATYLLQSLVVVFKLSYNWVQLFDFTQLDLFYDGWYSAQWGFMQDSTFWLHRTSHLGFLISLFLVFVVAAMRRRKVKQGLRKLYAAAGAAMLLTIASVYAYMYISLGTMAAVREGLDFYRPGYEITYFDMSGNLIESEARRLEKETKAQYKDVKANRFDLTLHTNNGHRLSAEATLEIVNGTSGALERFPVTLRHIFDIETLIVNGEKAEYERVPNKDYVWVKPAKPLAQGATAELSLTYGGKVNDWRYEAGFQKGNYMRAAFVDNDRILLPGTYGWFPMPGIYKLTSYDKRFFATNTGGTREEEVLVDEKFALPQAEYNVKFISDKPLDLVPVAGQVIRAEQTAGAHETQLQAGNATGFSLVAGPLKRITHKSGDVELSMVVDRWWTGPQPEQSLAALTRRTELALQLLEELWPKSDTGQNNAGQIFPQSLTLMSDDKRYRYLSSPFADLGPPIANADGMAYMTDTADMPLNPSYFRKSWMEMLLAHYFAQGSFHQNFTTLLAAYIDALAEPGRDKPLMPLSDNGAMQVFSEFDAQFNELYTRLPAEKFKQFLKAYYQFGSDQSLNYYEMQEKEREFVAGWAEGAR